MAAADALPLNLCDLPEAQYWRHGHKVRTYGCGGKKPKGYSRSKGIPLPVLSEIGNEDVDQSNVEEKLQSWWQCAACTFVNHELLPRCEVCNSPKETPVRANSTSQALSFQPMPGQACDWPALPEAWADCEVSSVASSWLDVGAANEFPDSDDEGASDVVLVDENSARAQVKPMLWSAVVKTHSDAASEPAFMPPSVPSFCKRVSEPRTKPPKQEETDAVLDELEARRMLGNSKQRHGGARKK